MNRISLILASILTISTLTLSQTWTSLNSPAGFKNVQEIAVSYRGGNGDTMYAADELKLLKSVNGGQSWSATASEIAGAVAVTCKYDDQGVVVASGPAFFSRSTNGGSSWSTPSITYNTNKPTVLADFPNNTGVMLLGKKYYSTSEKSIAKSTDGGASWSYTLSSSYKTQIFDIAINVSSAYPAMAIAAGCAVDGTVNDKGLYYTENYGDTWTARVTSTGGGWTAVAFRYHSATENQDTVYAGTADGGFYRSIWKASSMTLLKTFPDTVRSITIHPDSTWILFVTTDRSVYKSTDKGSTWNNYVSGMYDTRAFSLRFKPGSPNTVIVGSRGYLYRSTDYGTDWSAISTTSTRPLPFASLAIGASEVYAGSDNLTVGTRYQDSTWSTVRIGHKDSTFFAHGSINIFNGSNHRVVYHVGVTDNKAGVFSSIDSGITFCRHAAFDSMNTVVEGIAQDPSYPARLYAFGYLKDGSTQRNFFRSDDYGVSWTKSTSTISSNKWLAMRPLGDGSGARSKLVYAGAQSGGGSGGLYRSSDTSNSFTRVNSGTIGDVSINTIVNNPKCLAYAYVGASDGLYYSTNANTAAGGDVSFSRPWSVSGVKKIVIDPRFYSATFNAAVIFWVGTNNHLYRSENSGSTAVDMTGDLPAATIIYDMQTDPYDTTKIYVATDRGIYVALLAIAPRLDSPSDETQHLLWCIEETEPINLVWSNVPDVSKYYIQVDNISNFSSPEVNDSTNETTYSVTTDLSEQTIYNWRVRTSNGFGNSPWTERFWFRTLEYAEDSLLTAPNLLSPSNGSTGVILYPTLRWNAVPGANKYRLSVIGFNTYYVQDTSKQLSGLSHNTTYRWIVTGIDCNPSNPVSDTFSFRTQNPYGPEGPGTLYSEISEESVVTEYQLEQNYPNPFNPVTRFDYALPEAGHVLLRVYSTIGQEVARLVDEYQSAGWKSVEFDAGSLTTGVYFYRLDANHYRSMKKMVLIK